MRTIREFVRDHDEHRWVNILNATYGKFQDWRPITAEEHFEEEKRSDLAYDGRWIAELNGTPAGTVRAFVQTVKGKRTGYIDDLAVTPESAGLDVEAKLAELATDQLREQDVAAILVPRLRWFDPPGAARAEFLEKLGFDLIRQTSLMTMDLANVPSGITGNGKVVMRPLRESAEEDVHRLNRLRNECAKDQFSFHLSKVEETRYFLQNNPFFWLRAFFAMINDDYVSFSVLAIDEKYNAERNVKAGIILALGVLEGYRKTGIGTRLVLHGREVLRNEKMASAILDVDDLTRLAQGDSMRISGSKLWKST